MNCGVRVQRMDIQAAFASAQKPLCLASAIGPGPRELRFASGYAAVRLSRSYSTRCFAQSARRSNWAKNALEISSPSETQSFQNEQSIQSDTVENSGSDQFNWLAQWYPAGLAAHLDKRQPHAITVLGRDVVVWWSQSEEKWQVFADTCPHRLAPLSEGRINENGHIQCSYHGWAFAPSSGACTLIPQAPKDNLQFQQSKRACATVYKSTVQQGIIWVYLDNSEGAAEHADAHPPPRIDILDDPDFVYELIASDVPYGYETLVENLTDPSHVHFAHHKLQGNRKLASPISMNVEEISKQGVRGFRGAAAGSLDRTYQAHEFRAPVSVIMKFTVPSPKEPKGGAIAMKLWSWLKARRQPSVRQVATVFFCVPSSPGKSRLYFAFPRNFAKWVYHLTPRWLGHQMHMTVLDSDSYLLHVLERRLEEVGGTTNWAQVCFTPAASDGFVAGFRMWLKKYGSGSPDWGPKYSGKLPPTPPKRQLLDRQATHVAKCATCTRALETLQRIEAIFQVLPLALVGLFAYSVTNSMRALSVISLPLACLSVLTSRFLARYIEKEFFFHDYNHALVD